MITKLYLISATCPESGDDQGLFVSAWDDLEAILLWRRHWAVETEDLAEHEVKIIEVPEVSETSRAHPWHAEVSVTPCE